MGSNFALDDAQIAIIGRACRLPGAANVAEFWALLRDGRCAVSEIPADRWPLSRHGHPRVREPGRSYTWAAGVLPDVWGFDPAVFRISPREAQQIDPQQRLLLECGAEALGKAPGIDGAEEKEKRKRKKNKKKKKKATVFFSKLF